MKTYKINLLKALNLQRRIIDMQIKLGQDIADKSVQTKNLNIERVEDVLCDLQSTEHYLLDSTSKIIELSELLSTLIIKCNEVTESTGINNKLALMESIKARSNALKLTRNQNKGIQLHNLSEASEFDLTGCVDISVLSHNNKLIIEEIIKDSDRHISILTDDINDLMFTTTIELTLNSGLALELAI